jgi:hypothetical protein
MKTEQKNEPKPEKGTTQKEISKQKVQLSRDGKLVLASKFLDTIDIGVQKALFSLDVSKSNITSFRELKPQPNLKEIIAKDCPLSDFNGLSQQTKLTSITFDGTPIGDQKYSNIAALIVIGPKLNRINNQIVTQKEKKMATCYPPITKKLLESGWILQYPTPSVEDFKNICETFKIEYTDKDLEIPNIKTPEEKKSSEDEEKTKKTKKSEPNFAENVANILTPLGFPIRTGAEMNEDILNSVDVMIQMVQKAEKK